jgi:hypothetical protein
MKEYAIKLHMNNYDSEYADNLYTWLRLPSSYKLRTFKTREEAHNFIDVVLKPDNDKVFYWIVEVEETEHKGIYKRIRER